MIVYSQFFNDLGEELSVIAGTIVDIQKPGENIVVLNLSGEEYDNEQQKSQKRIITVTFENTEADKLADRVGHSYPGGFISILCELDGNSAKAREFKYKGKWDVPYIKQDGTEGKSMMIFGYATRPKKLSDDEFVCTIPYDEGFGNSKKTVWQGVRFSAKRLSDEKHQKLVERAEKMLSIPENGKSRFVAVSVGEDWTNEVNGTVYHNAYASNFWVL